MPGRCPPPLPGPRHRRRSAAALALALVLVVLAAACGSDGGTIQGLTREQPLQVGDQSLPVVAADGSGEPFRFVAEPGRVLVVYFGFTHCPDVCPTTLSDLRTALDRIGDDAQVVDVVFVTVDPDRDTPEVVTGYITSFVPDGRAARTTDPAELEAVEQAFQASSSVTIDDDGEPVVEHSGWTYVVDSDGTVVDEWAFGTTPEVMADDLAVLVDRAASG